MGLVWSADNELVTALSCRIVQYHAIPCMLAQMLTAQRKKLILSRLAVEGQIVAKDLALELGTSEDTIRRDLRELAQGGKLQRVHGGALPASAAVGDLKVREQVSPKDKNEVARPGPTTD